MQKTQPVNVFTFQFKNGNNHEVRTVLKDDDSIWFVAKDVCDVLELSNARKAVTQLDDDEKNTVTFSYGKRGNPKLNIISESGLYALVLRSNKPEAKEFRKWVTSEVLPQIRQTGTYSPAQIPAPANTFPPAAPHKEVVAFLQVSTDAYWHTINALAEHRVIEGELKKAKKAIAAILNSIKQVFPDARDVFHEIELNSIRETQTGLPLEVEMRGIGVR